MVRNSADHGLETSAERRALGKPERGRIRLSAYQEGGQIVIEIADDGRGLNAQRIKTKALAAGLVSEAELDKMTEAQVLRFIFAPGLSTAEQITSVSGRGVGMDVVKSNIDQIGGTVDVKSAAGAGCVFTIKIPLTLAIVSALIVEAAGDRFAIPQLAVMELVRIQANSEHRIERIKDTPVLRLRDKLLPLVHLAALLGLGSNAPVDEGGGFIVVVQVGSQRFGVVVDGVFHTEEIVVKPMSSRLRHIGMFSGNTILGDGAVIMIVDPNGIAEAVGAVASDMRETAEVTSAEADRQQTVSLLVFRAGSQELKAAPLSLVTRLEEIDCKSIEQSNGRSIVQYRGRLMPLLCIGEACRIRRDGVQQVLVFSEAERVMGLAVDEIVDIGYFLPLAFEDWFRRKEMSDDALTRTLLFVDDSAFFRNMLSPVLKAAGYEVTAVSGGQEALALLRKGKRFDALVTDLDMPEMDGFALAEAVRGEQQFGDIPIIALSSSSSPESIERGRRVGFHDYVAKFDRQSLIAALKEQTADVFQAA
jgi:two-component system chemotaxis sensor kinase CheA